MKMELDELRKRLINALVVILIVSITLSLVILFSEGRLFDWHYFLDNIDSYFQFTWISIILSIAAKKKRKTHGSGTTLQPNSKPTQNH